MKKILDGYVVLDLTRFFSGPQSTLMLAGMGAEVIKIDDPRSGDPTAFAPPFAGPNGISFQPQGEQDLGLAYLKRARGKKSATLNLKSDEGREIFLRMAAHADVIVENFSDGVATRLGIGYEAMRHPHLRERGTVRRVSDPLLGEFDVPGPVVRYSAWTPEQDVHAGLLGQHNAEVLAEILGMSEEEIDGLYADKVLVRDPMLSQA